MKVRKLLGILLVSVYILGIIYILFLRNHIHRFWPNLSLIEYFKYSSNFIPFKTIIGYVLGYFNSEFTLLTVVKNILGNLVLFIPTGFIVYDYLQCDTKKWIWFLFLTCFFLLLETIQAVFRVVFFDIDDIILYFLGFAIGIQLRKFLKRIKKNT